MKLAERLKIAAQWLRDADGILITAGAGMGVDSGLPDFCGEGSRTIPTVRNMSERSGHRVIRVTTHEWKIDTPGGIGLCARSLELLRALDDAPG